MSALMVITLMVLNVKVVLLDVVFVFLMEHAFHAKLDTHLIKIHISVSATTVFCINSITVLTDAKVVRAPVEVASVLPPTALPALFLPLLRPHKHISLVINVL